MARTGPRSGRAALAKLGATPQARAAKAKTPREKAYLDAVEILFGEGDENDRERRYALAMEQLHAKYPDDVDATCFYALALLGTSNAVATFRHTCAPRRSWKKCSSATRSILALLIT